MKTLFILGFVNPFAGAGWTRIGFFAEDWAKKGNVHRLVYFKKHGEMWKT